MATDVSKMHKILSKPQQEIMDILLNLLILFKLPASDFGLFTSCKDSVYRKWGGPQSTSCRESNPRHLDRSK
jgi:hypothetical protein